MSRYAAKVERALGRPILAASPVQAGGNRPATSSGASRRSLTGLLGRVGAVSVGRLHLRSERVASGFELTTHMLLAVAEQRVYLIECGPGWQPRSEIGSWDRSAVGVEASPGRLVHRLTLYFADRPEHLRLQAPHGRAIREVLEVLPKGRPDDPLIESDLAG